MPALPIPADLIDLQRALDAARAELAAFIAKVEAARREQFPAPEQVVERQTWPEGQYARREELRAVAIAADDAVRTHPVMMCAMEEHRYEATEQALRAAARGGTGA